jgi:hypothetical protein
MSQLRRNCAVNIGKKPERALEIASRLRTVLIATDLKSNEVAVRLKKFLRLLWNIRFIIALKRASRCTISTQMTSAPLCSPSQHIRTVKLVRVHVFQTK